MNTLTPSQWRSLLDAFTASMFGRLSYFHAPFEQDGYVYSTDSCFILRVSREICPELPLQALTRPKLNGIVPADAPSLAVSRSSLRSALNRADIDPDKLKIECPNCDIENQVRWEHTDIDGDHHSMFADCPCCDATGYIPNGAGRYLRMGKRLVRADHLVKACYAMNTLGIERAAVTFAPDGKVRFTLTDGVDIVFMNALPDKPLSPHATIKTEKP